MDFEKVKESFEKYIKSYDLTNKMINLKYVHSYKVANLMEELSSKLKLSSEEVTLAKIIGLLHDIGRFEQIRKFDKCSDIKTNTDHADESCNYLFDKGHIRDFIDTNIYDDIIESSIRYHNKYSIPDGLDERVMMFSKMIRDMDKVDIYRVVRENYEHRFDFSKVSKNIIDNFNSCKCINLHDIKTDTDKVFSYIGFIFDINYKESFKILQETGNLESYMNHVKVDKDSNDKFNEIKEKCYSYIKGEC